MCTENSKLSTYIAEVPLKITDSTLHCIKKNSIIKPRKKCRSFISLKYNLLYTFFLDNSFESLVSIFNSTVSEHALKNKYQNDKIKTLMNTKLPRAKEHYWFWISVNKCKFSKAIYAFAILQHLVL